MLRDLDVTINLFHPSLHQCICFTVFFWKHRNAKCFWSEPGHAASSARSSAELFRSFPFNFSCSAYFFPFCCAFSHFPACILILEEEKAAVVDSQRFLFSASSEMDAMRQNVPVTISFMKHLQNISFSFLAFRSWFCNFSLF